MENYSGNKDPFVYLAFAKEDAQQAEKIAGALAEKVKIFGSEDFAGKAKKVLEKAALVIPVISKTSASGLEELVSAAAAAGKDMVPVFLDDPDGLSEGMSMLLGTTQGHLRSKFADEESFLKELAASPALSGLKVSSAQKKSAKNTLIAGICAFVVVVAAVLLIALKPFSADRISKDSALGKLGLSGSASSIKKVCLYGTELVTSFEDRGVYQAYANSASPRSELYLPDADKTVKLGTLGDLTDFDQLVNLEELSLAGNSIHDITAITGLTKLKKLDLSAQWYSDDDVRSRNGEGLSLKGISNLKELEYLNLAYNYLEAGWSMSDIAEIKQLPKLKTLVLARDQEDLREQLGDVSFEIVYLGTSVSSYAEMKAAAADKNCHCISVAGDSVITIPAGEEFVLPKNVMLTTAGGYYTLNNNGTFRVQGWVEGLADENNNGKLVIESGGSWFGGMSDTTNNGEFIVDKGGLLCLERGKVLKMNGGSFTNNGTFIIAAGGSIEVNGGTNVNNSRIVFETSDGGFPPPEFFAEKREKLKLITNNGTIEENKVSSF